MRPRPLPVQGEQPSSAASIQEVGLSDVTRQDRACAVSGPVRVLRNWDRRRVSVRGAHRGDDATGWLVQALQAHWTGRQLPLVGSGLCATWLLLLRLLLCCIIGGRFAADLNIFHVDQAARDLRLQRRELRRSHAVGIMLR